MTLTNHHPAIRARAPIWKPLWLGAALIAGSGVVLLSLALLAAPLAAAQDQGASETTAQEAGSLSGTNDNDVVRFTLQLSDPGKIYVDGEWRWRRPTVPWFAAVAFGVLLAAAFLLILLAQVQRPTLIEPAAARRWFEDRLLWGYVAAAVGLTIVVYGDFGWVTTMQQVADFYGLRVDTVESAVPAALGLLLGVAVLIRLHATFRSSIVGLLVKDPLVWVYLFSAAGLAGALFSGSLEALSSEAKQALGAAAWAPAGVLSSVFGLLISKKTKKKMLIAAVAGEESHSFVELMRGRVDGDFRTQVSELATNHNVGLIQRTVDSAIREAWDDGRLRPDDQEKSKEVQKALSKIQPDRADGSAYLNCWAAVDLATRLFSIEELTTLLSERERRRGERRSAIEPVGEEKRTLERRSERARRRGERRSAIVPVGEEKRTTLERRMRSSWKADDLERSA